jgi:hypothetical protein
MPSSISLRPISRPWVRFPAGFWRPSLTGFLLVAAILAPAQTPSATTIHGLVLNGVTREPIARALVSSSDDHFAALTDDQGHFSFRAPDSPAQASPGSSVMPRGILTFHAGKPGFLDDDGSNLASSPNSADSPELVFTLTPESLIVGRVTLPSAGSFDRVSVQLYRREIAEGRGRWILHGNVRARANGEFRFSGLSAGTYKIFTDELLDRDPSANDANPDGPQLGYPPAYFPTASDFSSSAPIMLAAGQTFQAELSPVLHPYYPIKITLPNIQPAAGVSVTVAPYNQSGPGFSLGYNGQTQSIDGLLPNGTYTVEAISYGPPPASGVLTFTVHNAPVLTPTLLLTPGQSIPVNVKKEFAAPANDSTGSSSSRSRKFFDGGSFVNITLAPAEDFSAHPGPNVSGRGGDADGSRSLNAVPGRYWLQVNTSRGYVASATSAGVDLLLNPLVVGPGGSSAPIDIVLRDDTAEIDGTVEDSDLRKHPTSHGPHVYCVQLPDSPGNFTAANMQNNPGEDISFQCQQLSPGSYRVLALEQSQDQLEFHNPEAMRLYESKGPIVRVSGGQKETVRIPLNP